MMFSENRFWSKVDRGPGCWNWTAALYRDGVQAANVTALHSAILEFNRERTP